MYSNRRFAYKEHSPKIKFEIKCFCYFSPKLVKLVFTWAEFLFQFQPFITSKKAILPSAYYKKITPPYSVEHRVYNLQQQASQRSYAGVLSLHVLFPEKNTSQVKKINLIQHLYFINFLFQLTVSRNGPFWRDAQQTFDLNTFNY